MKLIVCFVLALAGTAVAQTPPDDATARKLCAQAMNANPDFGKSIALTVDKQIDQKTIAAHQEAAARIEQNERHVIFAYGAMWVIAALFVGFLWFRQQRLKAEIAALRRDLEDAAKDDKKADRK